MSKKKILPLSFSLLFTITLLFVYFTYCKPPIANPIVPVCPKIVVLGFANKQPDHNTEYFGAQLSHELETVLTEVGQYEIVAPISDADINKTLEFYKKSQDVNLAITGDYLLADGKIEVSAKLINLHDNGSVIFETQFTENNQDVSILPGLVATTTSLNLGLGLNNNSLTVAVDTPNLNREAYRLYLLSIDNQNRSNFGGKIELLEKAVRLQPDFYNAWVLLASSYLVAGESEIDSDDLYYEKALEAAKTAHRLKPEKSSPSLIQVNIYVDTGKTEDALVAFKKIPKDQSLIQMVASMGAYLCRYAGLLDESIEFDKSRHTSKIPKWEFEPEHYYRGDYEDFKDLQALQPADSSTYYFYQGLISLYRNKPSEAKSNFDLGRKYEVNDFRGRLTTAIALHFDGKTDEALSILKQLEATNPHAQYADGETLYYLVQAYSILGEKAGAIRVFRRAVNAGFFCYPFFERDPLLKKLRNDPQFNEVLEIAHQRHLSFKQMYYSN